VLASRSVCTPCQLLDCSIISDGAAVVVLTDGAMLRNRWRPRVHVTGSGCASDHVRLGDRADPHRFPGEERSSRGVCAMAGIEQPARHLVDGR
jgi:acetyl-CoA C-acetyltransferase